jgi:Uma2 family endonuclease
MLASASMTQAIPEPFRTYAEYLEIEARSELKHEWLDGRIYAMSGGTPDHSAIAANVIRALGNQLDGKPCRVFTSDLRVRVPTTGLATHPDVSVVCGRLECDAEDPNAATNPVVVVEVLSPSTERYDRDEKFSHFRRLASLRAYVLVSQKERRIEVFTRNDDSSWTLRETREGRALIEPIGCELAVDDAYRNPLE